MKIIILGTIKGLVSERDIVRHSIEEFNVGVIGLHIGKEELKGLKAVVKGKVENTYLSSYEKVYARELARFGEVQIPPPSLVEAYITGGELGITVKHLDMDEESYTDAYTKFIGGPTMIRQSLRLKRVNRKKFKSQTAEDFVLDWDALANKLKGFKRLEEKREKIMASRISLLSKKYGSILAIVELERMKGIVNKIV